MNSPSRPATSNFRWIICALLFFSTTVNYMDRQVISYLKEFFCTATDQGGFGWSNSDFANVTSAFTGFYAGMTILAGYVIDNIGTKLGLALSLIIWSVFGILNAFVGSLSWMHMIVRSLFGIGEAGNFPASIKTVAEWFPKRERALATGIFNSGSNVGAMISALFVPWCMIHFGDQSGWKMAYILTGAIGFFWLIFWFWLYDSPSKSKRISPAEYELIHSDKDEAKPAQADAKPAKKPSGSFFTFSGRIPREAFIGMTIMTSILCLFIYFITVKIVPDAIHNQPTLIFFGVVAAFALWTTLALQAKRWHDLGKSGWFVLLNLIPGLGTLASILILALRPSVSGKNEFGEEAGCGLLGHRQTWSFFAGKFLTDGVWWF
jgi:MFS family permease